MKQIDLSKQTKSRYPDNNSSRWRLWCMMLLAVFVGTVNSYGQTIAWDTPGLSISPENATVYGKKLEVEANFNIGSTDITTPELRITVPAGFTFGGISGTVGGVTVTPTKSTTTGTNWVFKYSTFGTNKAAAFVVTLVPTDAVKGNVSVSVYSGTTQVGTSKEAAIKNIYTPTISVVGSDVTYSQAEADTKTKKPFELKMYTSEGAIRSFQVALTVDKFVTLENFQLKGEEIGGIRATLTNPTIEETASGTDKKIYTITIGEANLTDGRLSTVNQLLTFDASSSYLGNRPIDIAWGYPLATSTNKGTGTTIYMKYPTMEGAPNIKLDKYTRTTGGVLQTSAAWYDIPLDGVTTNEWNFFYTNSGLDASELEFAMPNVNWYSEFQLDAITWKITAAGKEDQSGTIADYDVTKYLSDYNYTATDNKIPYTFSIKLPSDACLYQDGTLEINMPTIDGQIYNGIKSTTANSNGYPRFYGNRGLYLTYAVTKGGETQTVMSSADIYSFNSNVLYLTEALAFTVKKGRSASIELPLSTVALYEGKVYAEVFMRLPKYLTLKNPTNADVIYTRTTGSVLPSITVTPAQDLSDVNYNIYSWKIESTSGNLAFTHFSNTFMQLEIEAAASSSAYTGLNQLTGQVKYWVNHSVKGTLIKETSQRFQNYTVLCKEDVGISFDKEVVLERTTKGYELDGAFAKDDGSGNPIPVNKAKIRHDYYLVGDGGFFTWEATVLNGNAKHLYLLLESATEDLLNAGSGYFEVGQAKVDIKRNNVSRGVENMTYTNISRKKSSLLLSNYNFEAGDKLIITLPFTTSTTIATSTYRDLKTTAYISTETSFDSATSVLEGGDYTSTMLISVNADGKNLTNIGGEMPFTGNTALNIGFFRRYSVGGFYNEARTDKSPYVTEFTLYIPEGYELMKVYATYGIATYPILTPINEGGYSKYTFNASWKETLPHENPATAKVTNGNHWTVMATVTATKSAPRTAVPIKYEAVIYNPLTGQSVNTVVYDGTRLVYKGGALSLNIIGETTLPATIAENTVELTLGNPLVGSVNSDNWLYIEGALDYSTLKLTSAGGTALTPFSFGADYCWIQVPGDINGGESFAYDLSFTYTGPEAGGEVKMYTSSTFTNSTTWDPTTLGKLDPTDPDVKNYLGGVAKLTIVKPEPKLTGELIVSDRALSLNNEYNLTAILSGASSTADVKNPEMVITIPAGQKYVDGSAKVTWNGTTSVINTLKPAVEAALVAATANTASPQPFTFSAYDLFGDLLLQPSTGDAARQKITLTAAFRTDCNTELYNVSFKGVISGKTIYDSSDVLNNGSEYYTESMKATISAALGFQVAALGTTSFVVETSDTDPASATLQVTINRLNLNALAGTEQLRVILPKELSLNGSVSVDASSEISGISVAGATGGLNTNNEYVVAIPIDYTNMTTTGKVVYNIPLISSFTGASGDPLLATPLKDLSVSVTRDLNLEGCSSNPKPFPVSEEVKGKALFFAYDAGDKKVTAGTDYDVTALTTGITGDMT
ncbi:hypothetical protein, partial [Parabacteroides sp. 52]|uniref:hypothetical protein n=1 Tax=Parabacteroides sp. 52 TaxID=2302940 RepID=UPI0013D51082